MGVCFAARTNRTTATDDSSLTIYANTGVRLKFHI